MALEIKYESQRIANSLSVAMGMALLLTFFNANAQRSGSLNFEPLMFQYTTEDGLPSNSVYDIIQDSQGFLWIATDKGVSRYDGVEFENFSIANGLSSEEVLSIREDHQGRIWMLSFNGIPSYWKEGRFYNSENMPFLKEIRSETFLAAMHSDPNGNVFLAYYDGTIFRVDENNAVEKIVACAGVGCGINFLDQDSQGRLVSLVTSRKFWRWDQGKVDTVRVSDIVLWGPESYPNKGLRRSDGSFIYSWARSAFVLDSALNRKDYLDDIPGIHQGKIIFLGEDRQHKIWVGTTMGVYRYGKGGFENEPEAKYLNGVHISAIIQDDNGGYWLATRTGVWHLPEQDIMFAQIPEYFTATTDLSDGRMILGAKSGKVFEVDLATSEFKFTQIDPLSVDIPFRRIGKYRNHDEDVLLVGDAGPVRWHQGKLEQLSHTGLKEIAFHPQNDSICVCRHNGWSELHVGNISEMVDTLLKIVFQRLDHLGRCVLARYDLSGRLWVMMSNSSVVYHHGKPAVPEPLKEYMLRGDVTDLIPDNEGGMWIGLGNKGVLHLDGNDEVSWVSGLAEEGNTGIFSLLAGGEDHIWVLAKGGLYWVKDNVATLRLPINYLPGSNIVAVREEGEILWVVTSNGLCRIPKSVVRTTLESPRPFIRNLSIGDLDTLLRAPITLPYRYNTIQFTFRGISFQEHETVQYRYCLNGLEDQWQYTRGEVIRYSSLPPGRFSIELQARHGSGPWSESLVLPAISISPPYWQTWWFGVIVALASVLLVGLTFWLILKTIRRRNRLLMSSMQSEHQALIVQMNPHFIFNSLNSIQNYFLNDEKETANDFLADFSALMRSTLENSRSAEISLAEELKQLDLYLRLETMRLENRISYRFVVDPEVNVQTLRLPAMLLQPILENAVWHGLAYKAGQGEIVVVISKREDSILVEVTDDGVGREKARELRQRRKNHRPLATEIMKERIVILNKMNKRKILYSIEDLYDDEGRPAGTRVSLRIRI